MQLIHLELYLIAIEIKIFIIISGTHNTNIEGLVRVYDWNGTVWAQVGGDIVGDINYKIRLASMNANGDRIVVGTNTYGTTDEYLRTYDFNGTNWVQKGNDMLFPIINDVSINDNGDRLVIGIKTYNMVLIILQLYL